MQDTKQAIMELEGGRDGLCDSRVLHVCASLPNFNLYEIHTHVYVQQFIFMFEEDLYTYLYNIVSIATSPVI